MRAAEAARGEAEAAAQALDEMSARVEALAENLAGEGKE
jgi:hypothetical protein